MEFVAKDKHIIHHYNAVLDKRLYVKLIKYIIQKQKLAIVFKIITESTEYAHCVLMDNIMISI